MQVIQIKVEILIKEDIQLSKIKKYWFQLS